MISLIFKILADATGFNRTVDKEVPASARKAGAKAGKEAGDEFSKVMGGQMKAGIMRYLGAGAVLGAFTKFAADAAEITKSSTRIGLTPEAYQELKKAVDETGMSMDELQKKAALVPVEFEKMMTQIRAKGGIIPEADVNTLTVANEQIKEATSMATVGAGKVASILMKAWYGGAAVAANVLDKINGMSVITPMFSQEWETRKTMANSFRDYSEKGAEKIFAMDNPELASGSVTGKPASREFLDKLISIDKTLKDRL